MARTDNLTNFLTDVADAIRTKTGSADTIQASSFDTAIENIPSGQTIEVDGSTSSSKPGYVDIINNTVSVKLKDDSILTSYLFYGCKATSLPKVTNVTSRVTHMNYMFYDCTNVETIDVSGYDTSGVTNMQSMFQMASAATKLKSLNLSNFNIENVTEMRWMFSTTRKLAILDISSFDFTNVTNFSGMFDYCGDRSLQTDGAYANGIPYVYVKDVAAQTWVLTQNNGHPSTWTTDNVVIKSNS